MKPMLLVAEGDPELREIYRKFLAARSYDVQTAADGLECLRKLRRLNPAALVLDLELCWGGGDGVLARLREESAMPSTPVVLTATAGYQRAMAAFLDAPVVSFLPKPFALTALLENIRSAVATKGPGLPFNGNCAQVTELFIG